MSRTKSNTKYNGDFIKKIIENKRGGLMVDQLFEILPDEQKPNRKYFLEFLRSIPGVYVTKYDERMNRYFVTTLHGTEFSKRKLLVLLAAWEYKFKRNADWYKGVNKLSETYLELIKCSNVNYQLKLSNTLPRLLIEGTQTVSYQAGHQRSVFSKRHAKSSKTIESKQVDIGCSSKWGNPYKTSEKWSLEEVQELFIAHYLENNLHDALPELLNKELICPTDEEAYHKKFLIERVSDFDNCKNEFKRYNCDQLEVSLYTLYRSKVYLSINKNLNLGVGNLVFHVFDCDDNLTMKKMSKITATISEFIAQHNLCVPFKINVYTWNEKKARLYSNRFMITGKTIRNIEIIKQSRKEEYFMSYFEGFRFISLETDRFLEVKGKHYWMRPDNRNLLNYSSRLKNLEKLNQIDKGIGF